jgi:hypothetical protein
MNFDILFSNDDVTSDTDKQFKQFSKYFQVSSKTFIQNIQLYNVQQQIQLFENQLKISNKKISRVVNITLSKMYSIEKHAFKC